MLMSFMLWCILCPCSIYQTRFIVTVRRLLQTSNAFRCPAGSVFWPSAKKNIGRNTVSCWPTPTELATFPAVEWWKSFFGHVQIRSVFSFSLWRIFWSPLRWRLPRMLYQTLSSEHQTSSYDPQLRWRHCHSVIRSWITRLAYNNQFDLWAAT